MWNKTNMKPLAEADLTVVNPCTKENHQLRFIVVPNQLTCFLGLNTVQKLKLLSMMKDAWATNQAHLHVYPGRSLPRFKVCYERNFRNLINRGVLIPITEPTPWVSQMAIARKANGNLRLCIDISTKPWWQNIIAYLFSMTFYETEWGIQQNNNHDNSFWKV